MCVKTAIKKIKRAINVIKEINRLTALVFPTDLVPAHPGWPGKRAVKQVCCCLWSSALVNDVIDAVVCRQERMMTEQGLYVLSPNPVYDVVGEGESFFCLVHDSRFW